MPVLGSQAPARKQANMRLHCTPSHLPVPRHIPERHTSSLVSSLPSSQDVSSSLTISSQLPVWMSQLPASWQSSLGVQVTFAQRLIPLQTPLLQTSLMESSSPSSQALPPGFNFSMQNPVAKSQMPTS